MADDDVKSLDTRAAKERGDDVDDAKTSKQVSRRKGAKPKRKITKAVAAGDEGAAKRVHRFKPGTVAIRQIKKYQKSVENLLPRATFKRLVKEIADKVVSEGSFKHFEGGIRFKSSAVDALQVRKSNA